MILDLPLDLRQELPRRTLHARLQAPSYTTRATLSVVSYQRLGMTDESVRTLRPVMRDKDLCWLLVLSMRCCLDIWTLAWCFDCGPMLR